MNDENKPRRGHNDQWLKARQEMLLSALEDFRREERNLEEVQDETHADLETEVLSMHDALWYKRDHEQAAKTWSKFEMDAIPAYCNAKQKTVKQTTDHFGNERTETEVEIERAPPDLLKNWARAFVKMVDDLGLNTGVRKESGELYAIKRDPENYDDPVNEDIPKPE